MKYVVTQRQVRAVFGIPQDADGPRDGNCEMVFEDERADWPDDWKQPLYLLKGRDKKVALATVEELISRAGERGQLFDTWALLARLRKEIEDGELGWLR